MTAIAPKDFWREATNMSLISQAHIGLPEKITELERKINNTCLINLGLTAFSVIIYQSAWLNRYVKVLALGVVILSIFDNLPSKYKLIRTVAKTWLSAFQQLANGEYDDADKLFRQLIMHQDHERSEILSPLSKKSLGILSLHEGALETESKNTPTRVAGYVFLFLLCHKANKGISYDNEEWKKDLNICERLFGERLVPGLTNAYQEVYLSLVNHDITNFALPILKSPGHGLLMAIGKELYAFNLTEDFNDDGELIEKVKKLGNLEGWKTSIRKAKEAIQKVNLYGPHEESFIEAALECSTLQRLTFAFRRVTLQQQKIFYRRMLTFIK